MQIEPADFGQVAGGGIEAAVGFGTAMLAVVEAPGGIVLHAQRLPNAFPQQLPQVFTLHFFHDPAEHGRGGALVAMYRTRGMGEFQIRQLLALVGAVVEPRHFGEGAAVALRVVEARAHIEQVPDGLLRKQGIGILQLGQVLRYRVIDAFDEAVVYGDTDQQGGDRFTHREEGRDVVGRVAFVVILEENTVVADYEESRGARLLVQVFGEWISLFVRRHREWSNPRSGSLREQKALRRGLDRRGGEDFVIGDVGKIAHEEPGDVAGGEQQTAEDEIE